MRRLLPIISLVACAGEPLETTPAAREVPDQLDDGRGDRDADGVLDRDDACLDSVFVSPRHPTAVRGCSVSDLMADPWPLWTAPRAAIDSLAADLDDAPSLEPARASLDRALIAGDQALDDIGRGDNCGASQRFGDATGALRDALGGVTAEIDARARHAGEVAVAGRIEDDIHAEGAELAGWRLRGTQLEQLAATLERIGGDYERLCREVRPRGSIRGEVAAYDGASRVMTLTDGTTLAVHDLESVPAIVLGSDVTVQLVEVGGGLRSGAIVVESPGLINEQVLIQKSKCLQLAFVPNQAPVGNAGLVLHDPAGYADHGYGYWLEQGMRLSATDSECDQGGIGTNDYFSYRLKLKYWKNGVGWKTKTLALDVSSATTPIKLPADMSTILPGTLTAERYHTSCTWNGTPLPSTCTQPKLVTTDTYPLYVLPRNYYCAIDYSKVLFTLEDDDLTGHQTTMMNGATLHFANPDPNTTQTILATGHPIINGAPSPGLQTIHQYEQFAIRNYDFFPIWPSQGLPNPHWTGVDQPSGVMWPHIKSWRNGAPFRYSCRVPELTRDGIADCGGEPHCLYRLPFDAMHTTHVTQGNFGSYTHQGSQAYAYDFGSPSGTPIHAARGGVVVQVVSDVTVNCTGWIDKTNCPFAGNFVAIRHHDGTVALYAHMITNTPAVWVGNEVHRGDYLGLVGNTGNSTGPHLHMHVLNTSTLWSIPIRFELIMQGTGAVEVCQNPGKNWYPTSTNNLW